MKHLVIKLILVILAILLIPLAANADTYVIYYPELEMVVGQQGFIDRNDIHIIIHTKHLINQNNYCYMKLLQGISPSDKFILLPDKNIDTLEVRKYE